MTGVERDTVVLPLAGTARRLGLPTPKELLPIGEGQVALDATVDLLALHAGRLRVVAVLGERWIEREATVRHLRARCQKLGIPIAVIFQDAAWPESSGAVISAAAWFGTATLVLLADQVLANPAPRAVGEALDLIHSGAEAVFLTAWEHNIRRLAADGALRLGEGPEWPRVEDIADKPGEERARAGGFNAVWFGYGFRDTAASKVLAVMHQNELRRPLPDGLGSLLGAPVVDVGPFTDLGTWPSLAGWWREEHR